MDGLFRIRGLQSLLLLILVIPSAGCIGLAAQALYVLRGHKLPAEFEDLKSQRVAVVCVSEQGSMGSDSVTYRISQLVTAKLAQNVKKIEIIPQAEIQRTLSNASWERVDYAEIGRQLKADKVLAIELSSYSTTEGATLFKGRTTLTTTVYDMEKQGTLVYTQGPDEFAFPRDGRPKMGTSERDFENRYLAKLSMFIAQRFYKHERDDSVKSDESF